MLSFFSVVILFEQWPSYVALERAELNGEKENSEYVRRYRKPYPTPIQHCFGKFCLGANNKGSTYLYFGQFAYILLRKFVFNDFIKCCSVSMEGESCIYRIVYTR